MFLAISLTSAMIYKTTYFRQPLIITAFIFTVKIVNAKLFWFSYIFFIFIFYILQIEETGMYPYLILYEYLTVVF